MPDQINVNPGRPGKTGGNSHVWTGFFLILIGLVAFLRINNPDFPKWIFSWQMLLIALGLFIGFRHNFRRPAWLVLVLVGGIFLYSDLYPEVELKRYIVPIVLVSIGALIMFRPKHSRRCRVEKKNLENNPLNAENMEGESTAEDYVDSTSIFGGAKKNIISKNFRGGDLVNIFGGTELDLTRADFTGTAEIEITTIFGGTKLIIPSNWTVRSEAVTLFGGLEDKRNMSTAIDNPAKTLILKGTVIFGGIELKSY
jgi:predicted membrane protein